MSNLTPYQGTKRQFGFFFCQRCSKSWQSGFSWANTGQKCKSCYEMVYPFKQQLLEQSHSKDNLNTSAPHPKELCGKCMKLGHACNLRYYKY